MNKAIEEIGNVVLLGVISSFIIFIPAFLLSKFVDNTENEPNPMAKQNVVCDTSYGVQYFEHKGVLTLRVNHEGKPIKCYE